MVRLLAAAVDSPLSGSELVRLAAGKRTSKITFSALMKYPINFSVVPRVCENYFTDSNTSKNVFRRSVKSRIATRKSNQRTLVHVLFQTMEFSHTLGTTDKSPQHFIKDDRVIL